MRLQMRQSPVHRSAPEQTSLEIVPAPLVGRPDHPNEHDHLLGNPSTRQAIAGAIPTWFRELSPELVAVALGAHSSNWGLRLLLHGQMRCEQYSPDSGHPASLEQNKSGAGHPVFDFFSVFWCFFVFFGIIGAGRKWSWSRPCVQVHKPLVQRGRQASRVWEIRVWEIMVPTAHYPGTGGSPRALEKHQTQNRVLFCHAALPCSFAVLLCRPTLPCRN
jgi:hypothetical protein